MMHRTKWLGVSALVTALVVPIGTAQATAQAASGWRASPATGVSGPISSSSDTDAWALGDQGFARWNGTRWQQFPAPSGRGTVLAISDRGPADAWAVGRLSHGYKASSPQISHWNGTSWSISPSPAISARNASMNGVAAVGPGDAWAVGNDGHNGLVEHWNGTGWSRVTVPDPAAGTSLRSRLTAVSARSANDVWAVGTHGNAAPLPDSLYALHYDGSAWRLVAMAQTASQTNGNIAFPHALVAIAPNDVWMVGTQSNFSSPITLTEHWNGSRWSIVPSPFDHVSGSSNSITNGVLNAVTARSSGEVWAAGYYFTFADGDSAGVYHSLLIRWDGTRWIQDTAPTTGTYNPIRGISTTPGGHVIWATNAGSPGLLTHP